MKHELAQDHFSLFGLSPSYYLDLSALEGAYREVQSQVHPDRFISASESERRISMQWATRANEAYRTLKDPVQRARYLLELHGVDTGFETNTAMAPEFLMRQMELRETLEEARDVPALDALAAELRASRRELEASLASTLDVRRDFAAAAQMVRELQFLHRFGEDLDAAYVALEDR